MDRNLALEFVRVTEAAAIAASRWIGKGEAKKADGAAVKEMRARFNQIDFRGVVVIGEGAKDEAPELFQGEKVGSGWQNSPNPSLAKRGSAAFEDKHNTKYIIQNTNTFDLAVDPLECTDSVAFGRYNAMSVIAAGSKGSLLSAPDTYMEKIAAGPKASKVISLNKTPKQNIENVAKALGKKVSEITVCVLDRERHKSLIEQIRKAGARVRLITDGDVAGAIATCMPESGIDLLMGIGASAEAVLASAAIRALGGQLEARFKPKTEAHSILVKKQGLSLTKIYQARDLVKGNVLTFTATGIIDGPLLKGVRTYGNIIETHSIVIRAKSGTIRYINTQHRTK